MIFLTKINLITGFLGSGKTTFIKHYASYLVAQGYKVGILENDFGAVNVDMMLLQDALGHQCDLEMITGGGDQQTHQRRFKTKLISMGMLKYDYLLVEPSGIYEVDEFFDVLHEEPLENWYEIGHVYTIVNAKLEQNLSKSSRYLLASQIAHASCILLSHYDEALQEEIQQTKQLLQKSLQEIQCSRILQDYDFYTHWNHWNDEDFQWMMSKQIIFYDYVKYDMDYQKAYTSLYFMNTHLNQESLKRTVLYLFNDTRCGDVFRIKGFICENDQWFEMNATRQSMSLTPISIGQDVMIVIGEHLNKEEIQSYFHKKTS